MFQNHEGEWQSSWRIVAGYCWMFSFGFMLGVLLVEQWPLMAAIGACLVAMAGLAHSIALDNEENWDL